MLVAVDAVEKFFTLKFSKHAKFTSQTAHELHEGDAAADQNCRISINDLCFAFWAQHRGSFGRKGLRQAV